MHLEGVSREEIPEVNIPTGVPRRYEFDDRLAVLSAEYLGDPDEVAAKAAAVAAQAGGARRVPIGVFAPRYVPAARSTRMARNTRMEGIRCRSRR